MSALASNTVNATPKGLRTSHTAMTSSRTPMMVSARPARTARRPIEQQNERRGSRSHESRRGDERGRNSAERTAPESDAARVRVQPQRVEVPAEDRGCQAVTELVRQRRDEDQRPADRPAERDRIEERGNADAQRQHARRAAIDSGGQARHACALYQAGNVLGCLASPMPGSAARQGQQRAPIRHGLPFVRRRAAPGRRPRTFGRCADCRGDMLTA